MNDEEIEAFDQMVRDCQTIKERVQEIDEVVLGFSKELPFTPEIIRNYSKARGNAEHIGTIVDKMEHVLKEVLEDYLPER